MWKLSGCPVGKRKSYTSKDGYPRERQTRILIKICYRVSTKTDGGIEEGFRKTTRDKNV